MSPRQSCSERWLRCPAPSPLPPKPTPKPTSCQATANTNWRQQLVHMEPAFPSEIFIVPQREEIQLTARLCAVTPAEFAVGPPSDDDDVW